MYAFAQSDGDEGDDIEVLVQESEWDSLHAGGTLAHHARGTFMHEFGHCILHVPQIRRLRALGLGLPRQMRPREIKTYCNAEWQAWAFAGCMLAPRASILAAGLHHVELIAATFKRLGIPTTPRVPQRRTRWFNR